MENSASASGDRIIGHIDMDAFFAAVEERQKPYLKGCPIVVGSDPKDGTGRGVVATANYAARAYGIRSAMPIREAWRRSVAAKRRGEQAVIFITPNFKSYSKISGRIFGAIEAALLRELPQTVEAHEVFEQVSVDEAYLDLSLLGSFGKAELFLRRMQDRVIEFEGLTMSVGLGTSKLVAKIASDLEKPKGFVIVPSGNEQTFLKPLSIRAIPGVGPKYAETLYKYNLKTIGDIQKEHEQHIVRKLGRRGLELFAMAFGRDDRIISGLHEQKSIGEQETLPEDVVDLGELLPRLYSMAGNVWRRLKEDGFRGCKRIALTVRFANFSTKVRSRTFAEALRERHVFERFAVQLLLPFLDHRENAARAAIRMIGLRVEKLEEC